MQQNIAPVVQKDTNTNRRQNTKHYKKTNKYNTQTLKHIQKYQTTHSNKYKQQKTTTAIQTHIKTNPQSTQQ